MKTETASIPFEQALEPRQQRMIVCGDEVEWMEAVKEVIKKTRKRDDKKNDLQSIRDTN
jgi:hypothetical protein